MPSKKSSDPTLVFLGTGGAGCTPPRGIDPRLAIATHIEELNGRSYADYLELEEKYKKYRLRFAYDGLRISI